MSRTLRRLTVPLALLAIVAYSIAVPAQAQAPGLVKPYAEASATWQYAAATSGIANTTTAVTVKAAAGAGLRNYVTSVQIQHAALGNATELVIRDGAGGTVLWRTSLGTTAMPLTTIVLPVPLKGSVNTLLEVATLTQATGGVFVNLQGYVAP